MQVDHLKSLLEEFRPDSRYDHTSGKQKIEWTLSEANGDVKTITVIKDEIIAARVRDLLTYFKSLLSLTFEEIDLTDLTTMSYAKICAVDSLRSLKLFHSSCADRRFALPPDPFQGMAKLDSLELGSVASVDLEEIAELHALKRLAIHRSDLEAIPPVVFQLRDLTTLDFSSNKIAGPIPPSISALRNLKTLNLSENQITGGFEHLVQLTELEEVDLHWNKISGLIPPSISALRSLKKLDLSYNQLTGGLEHLAQLTELEEVNLRWNKIAGLIPPELEQLRKLKKFDLCENLLSGSKSAALVRSTTFNFEGNKLTGYYLGPNPVDVYFLEKSGSYLNSAVVVNFADWSPLLIKYPKHVMKQIEAPLTPVTFVNKIFPALRVFLRKLCEAQNPCVLNALARLWYAFTHAAKKHPAEEDDLLSFANEIAAITTQLFKCSALDDTNTFYRLVLPKQYIWQFYREEDTCKLWRVMHVFDEGTPIKLCMDCEFKQVLASPAVANIMEYLFYNGINLVVEFYAKNYVRRDDAIFNALSCPRYVPVMLFLLEGLSKAVVLLLVASVTIGVYGRDGHTAFANSTAEGFLLLMLFTQLCYEVGQVDAVRWSLKKHFSDIWNGLDAAALALIAAWALLCCFPRQFDVARTLLSLSAIPLSLQMLQYISLVKVIGLLVLMIKSMIVDVMVFVLVYVVSIFGFGVCFYGLFYGESSFHSSGATLLYLFQSTLGNFDFDALSDSKYTGIGTGVLVVFLVLTSVLLVNLLIAQMSSTYSRIKDKSREEWSYIMASYVQEFIHLRERTPLCMLPPPLNAITTALAPLHYWALPRYKISIAGTVADYVLGNVLVLFSQVYLLSAFFRYERKTWNSLFCMPFNALVRIFHARRVVTVVPAPKPNIEHKQEYDIWYNVKLQRDMAESKRAKAKTDDDSATNGTDGVQLQSFPPASGGEQGATVSALYDAEVETESVPPPATEEASGNSQKVVVIYTEDDIRRMFPAGADEAHHLHLARHRADVYDTQTSAIGGADTAASTEAALKEVKAQNEEVKAQNEEVKRQNAHLQAEMAEMKAAQAEMKMAQEQSNATQAEMRAAQAETLALVKTILKK